MTFLLSSPSRAPEVRSFGSILQYVWRVGGLRRFTISAAVSPDEACEGKSYSAISMANKPLFSRTVSWTVSCNSRREIDGEIPT